MNEQVTQVMQVGLYSTEQKEVEDLIHRVAKFNDRRLTNIVLDIEWHDKGDAEVNAPHCKLRLTFPSSEVQDAFWTE